MTKNLKLILSTFTRQQQLNDCGMACLASIFKYAGINTPRYSTENSSNVSLLDLHKICNQAGLISKCVRMDMATLNEMKSPCILHVLNDSGQPHFVVHYPGDFNAALHLVGDPDRKIELMPEDVLLMKWESKAALFFEDLKPRNGISHWWFPWNNFNKFRFIPKVLWFAVPFLNVVAAMLGLAVSLIIQKAVEPGFLSSKQGFFVLLFILLALVSIAKCAINYLRQWMMIKLGARMDSKLSSMFLGNLHQSYINSNNYRSRFYFKAISEIQKIHQATAVLVGIVFSDGLLVMVMFGCLYFYQPAFVLLEIASFLCMMLVIDKYLPLLLIHYDNGQSQGMLAPVQGDEQRQQTGRLENECFAEKFHQLNELFAKKTSSLSGIANRINLYFDAIGTINIIIVLAFSICKLQAGFISYEQFLMTLILCYGMGMLMAKICNQLFTIAQGADMLRQNTSHEIEENADC
ncbi:MAG: lagD 1 [Mucilaginibacter sp.]|nr:lagD 1 [Mucilaginibacter sp.]